MSYQLMLLLSLSLLLPTIACTIKIPDNPKLYPLLSCFYFGLVITILGYFFKKPSYINTATNIYILSEFVLIIYQFHIWRAGFGNRVMFLLTAFGLLLWVWTTFWLHSFSERNAVFRLYYSLIIVLCSIDLINKLVYERIYLFRNWRFVLAMAFVIFYSYNIVVETFWLSKTLFSTPFLTNIFVIKVYINFVINIIYFIALLCIPKRKNFLY
jgi:hypothetical protein